MKFIEVLFGFAPDGGNGLLEVSLIVVGSVVLTALVLIRKVKFPARD